LAFAGRRVVRGTSDWLEAGVEEVGGGLAGCGFGRRLLKDEMNSRDCGESPRMFCKCSAAAGLERLSVYAMISFNDSASRGSRRLSWGSAQFASAIDEDVNGSLEVIAVCLARNVLN